MRDGLCRRQLSPVTLGKLRLIKTQAISVSETDMALFETISVVSHVTLKSLDLPNHAPSIDRKSLNHQ